MIVNQKIGIIGGGLTGLTAAYRLSLKGYKVTILERSETLGGLMGGFEINGTSLEKAYHHIFKTDKNIINLIKEIGLEDKLSWNDSSIGLYYDGKMYPFVTPMELLKFKPLNIIDKVRLGLVGLYLQFDNNWEKYVPIPAYQWMKKWAGENAYRVVWEPLLKGKFHDSYKKVSMAWLWARIHTRGKSKEKGDTGEKLGYVIGGFDQISQRLADLIKKNGGEILTNTIISNVKCQNSKIQMKTEKEELIFDKVLAAVPSQVLGNLIDQKKYKKYIEKLNQIEYLGAVVMVMTSKQSLSTYYWHNINDTNSPFLAFLQHTNLIDKKNYRGDEVYYLGTYVPHSHKFFEMSDESVEKEFLDYLKNIFPEFDQKQVKQKFLFKLKNAQHIVDTKYPSKIPAYKTPIPNLYLSNFAQIFPEDRGTNFAVREGEKVAEIIDQKS